jgi:methylated-DNA-[protein]-cysteine S-methyltransferase
MDLLSYKHFRAQIMSFSHPQQYSVIETNLGSLFFCSSPTGISRLWFAGQKYAPDTKEWHLSKNLPFQQELRTQINAYLAHQLTEFDLPLAPQQGTAFQHQVWHALQTIPYGHTTTYSELSQQMSAPNSVRAVASAIGRNPLLIIVPCHRVIGNDGKLRGYAAGLETKNRLLNIEKMSH